MSGQWQWVPEGWRVVPEDATEQMEQAAWKARRDPLEWSPAEAWDVMITAAPKPPSGWQEGNEPPPGVERLIRSKMYGFHSVALDVALPPHLWAPLPPSPEDKP
jgi:hypothetical protein